MGTCVAVHAWLQAVLGVLLPLLVMWALEERSRLRFQRQWLQHHAARREASAGVGTRPPPQAATLHTRPVPGLVLAAWLAACALAMWALMEAALL